MAGILINNLVREKDITKQHTLLDSDMFAKLLCKSKVSCSPDLEQSTLFDLAALGCHIGPRVSK